MAVNIAIDGPSGAGKSSLARSLAEKLGYVYVDTGALYRAVGVAVLRRGLDTSKSEDVNLVLEGLDVRLKYINGEQRVFLADDDVSEDIRRPEASMAASNVSAIPEVREFLFDLQRDIAKANNCVMDGRDIGTVVLPNADVKMFLTASAKERAMRRYKELVAKGNVLNFEDVLKEIEQRDFNDSNRKHAPLKKADDAIVFDNTGMSLDESLKNAYDIVTNKLKAVKN